MLAKNKGNRKKRAGKQGKDRRDTAVPDVPMPLLVPDEDVSTLSVGSSTPSLPASWREVLSDEGELFYYNDATGVSQWEPPEADVPAAASATNTMEGATAAPAAFAFDAPLAESSAGEPVDDFDDEALPRWDGALPFGDGVPSLNLPSFDEYAKGPSKPLPPEDGGFRSKLPPVNPGRSPYDQFEQEVRRPLATLVQPESPLHALVHARTHPWSIVCGGRRRRPSSKNGCSD